jgi:hypothetical protein
MDFPVYPMTLHAFVEIRHERFSLLCVLLFQFLSKFNKLQRIPFVVSCIALWSTPVPSFFNFKAALCFNDFAAIDFYLQYINTRVARYATYQRTHLEYSRYTRSKLEYLFHFYLCCSLVSLGCKMSRWCRWIIILVWAPRIATAPHDGTTPWP